MFLRTRVLCAIAAMALSGGANAWDGAVSGRVVTIEVFEGQNYGFRVWLSPGGPACTGGPGWSYLVDTDSNYKVYVAALMTAKAMGSMVTVYSTKLGTVCHIGAVTVAE